MSSRLPPELRPPEPPRRFRLYPHQWVGLPVLLVVPLLAALGVLGERKGRATAAGAGLSLHVEFPATYRYRQREAVRITAENRSGTRLDTLTVSVEPAYLGHATLGAVVPAPAEPFVFRFAGVEPGGVRRVLIEVEAARYGRHHGTARAYAPGRPDTARAELRTFVFP